MRLSILLLIAISVSLVIGDPINIAIPAAVPQQQQFASASVVESKPFPSEPIVESPSTSITASTALPVHLLPLKLDLSDAGIDELGTGLETTPTTLDVDNNPSHEGEALVDIGGDVNLDITILAGLEADAAQTAAGELTSFEGASEEEIQSMLEGVVDEQDLDAFDGISDADIDADGDAMIDNESLYEGKEEEDKDKEEHEKQEKKEEEEKEKEKKEGGVEVDKEKDKDASGKEIEIESGIKVENPVNHGEVTVNYVENLNLKLRGGRHHKFRGLHHLARKLRLMKRIAKWFTKPVHSRLSLLRFAKYHKLRVLELKLRLMKLKFLTNAIKMLRLARLITIMKVKGDLTKLAIGHALFRKFRHPSIDVKTDVKDESIANRIARFRAFKNLLRARRLARYRMMTSPILSRRAFHSRAFSTSPILSSRHWNRRASRAFPFTTSPILSSPWSHPSRLVSSPIVSGHLLALRGSDIDESNDGTTDDSNSIDNEGLYEDLLRIQQQHQPSSFPFTTAPILSEQQQLTHPYNIMFAGETDPSQDVDTDNEAEADDNVDTTGEYQYQPFSME